ncbi:hypothetical protein [Pollutibacter soli]|uniref:dioxygenase family protein n=1 Tax=Pollutibacter soli TaxID=3034157 RepID=UPI003013CDE6
MKRRDFIFNSGLSVIAVSSSGFIHFDGQKFIGDCETTTDILGPFYRPDSPVRSSLVFPGAKGTPVELSGKIRHTDCVTPYVNAKVELWHCDSEGQYDNSTQEFRYRGTVFTDDKGNYKFNTMMPVPYGGVGFIRPAHFHLMVTAKGYMPLVTQLYFEGDEHIKDDPASSAATSKSRILKVQKLKSGSQKIVYNVSMTTNLVPESASLDKLTGTYTDISDANKKMEIFKKDNTLWIKNEVFGEGYKYIGENSFESPGMPDGSYEKLSFVLKPEGVIQMTIESKWGNKRSPISIFLKDKSAT